MGLYHESPDVPQPHRRRYRDAIHALVDQRFDEQVAEREAAFDPSTARRDDLLACMGWPLHDGPARNAKLIEATHLADDDDGSIHRLIFDVLPGHGSLPLAGLLLLPHRPGPHALCLSQHGGDGTAELCSGLYQTGSSNYNDQSRRLVRRGYAVFAPQLLLWKAAYGDEHDRQAVNQRLNQLDGSIAAVEVFAIRSAIDRLLERPDIDGDRLAMMGLSYGGFYTLVTTAVDPRVQAAVVSCIFHDGRTRRQMDMAWPNSVRRFGFAEIAALIAPRPLYVEHGRTDSVIDMTTRGAEAVAARTAAYFQQLGAGDRFTFHIHDGWHETDPADHWLNFLERHVPTYRRRSSG